MPAIECKFYNSRTQACDFPSIVRDSDTRDIEERLKQAGPVEPQTLKLLTSKPCKYIPSLAVQRNVQTSDGNLVCQAVNGRVLTQLQATCDAYLTPNDVVHKGAPLVRRFVLQANNTSGYPNR